MHQLPEKIENMDYNTAQNKNGKTIKSRKTAEIKQKDALTQHREMWEKKWWVIAEKLGSAVG